MTVPEYRLHVLVLLYVVLCFVLCGIVMCVLQAENKHRFVDYDSRL